MRVLHFSGTPRALGEGFGETCREQIGAFYRARVDNAIVQAKDHGGREVTEDDVLAVASRGLIVAESWDPDGYAELLGIARAANLSATQLYAMNGLTDFRDHLAWGDDVLYGGGCSSFLAQADRTASGRPMCGQTWDLATDNMPFVIGVHRAPADAPATWSLTTVGCLSLIGMNEEGLAIGTTNLRTTDTRVGICYLSIIHRALAERRAEDAARIIARAPRAGGHYYYLCDRAGQQIAVECTGRQHHLTEVERGHYVTCNHVLHEPHKQLEGDTPKASSMCRIKRLDGLIGEAEPSSLSADDLVRFLSDHTDGEGAICRHDLNGISSNGAAIMTPAEPSFRACHGHPCDAEWIDMLTA